MTLVYRAIWQDSTASVVRMAEEAFGGWLTQQGIEVELGDEGRFPVPDRSGTIDGATDGEAEVQIRRGLRHNVDAVQLELKTHNSNNGRSSLTRLTAIDVEDADGWLWVDLEQAARPGMGWPLLSAPTLVHDLLDKGNGPRVDQVRLTRGPQHIPPVGLVGLIGNRRRTLPLVVFSEGPAGYTSALARAEEVAHRLAGAAMSVILPITDSPEFHNRITEGLGVADGAARVFLPNAGESGLDPDRHRLLRYDQMSTDPIQAARILSSVLGSTITARRPPTVYDEVRRELRLGRSRSDAELLAVAESEIDRLTVERNQLKNDREYTEELLLNTQADLEAAVIEASRLQNQLQAMIIGDVGTDDAEAATNLSREVSSITEAISVARECLKMIVIPDGVEKDVAELDANLNSVSWGNLTWRGLRALHCYADVKHDGDFRHWCATSGEVWAWPATEKKLALNESETVKTNRRYAEQRRFPVDEAIDPSGTMIMWSHLKISEGGGPMAPRIYFHDDTRGSTGKVHVGFIGPHRYTENTRTN